MLFIDATAVAALGPGKAVRALTDALLDGLDPTTDPPRTAAEVSHGQLLLMPSETPTAVGVKIVAVAPSNADLGLPRIHGTYLLYDRETLVVRAALDGTALTTLRTPAVSVAAVLPHLPERALHVAIIGAGPQATGHLETLAAVRPIERATFLVRDPSRTTLDATALGSAESVELLREADVVVCATSARTPLFDSALLRDDVVVIAVGTHQPDARELDASLLARSTVIVEDIDTALREAGDVVLAIADGAIAPADLLTMRDVVNGRAPVPAGQPLVFKSVGMAWQDLVVAEAVVRL